MIWIHDHTVPWLIQVPRLQFLHRQATFRVARPVVSSKDSWKSRLEECCCKKTYPAKVLATQKKHFLCMGCLMAFGNVSLVLRWRATYIEKHFHCVESSFCPLTVCGASSYPRFTRHLRVYLAYTPMKEYLSTSCFESAPFSRMKDPNLKAWDIMS